MAEQRAQIDAGSFAATLRRYRSAANLTQEELAARAGLSVHAIGMLERGVRKAPRPSTVALLAVALELEPAERHALVVAARIASIGFIPNSTMMGNCFQLSPCG